MSFRAFVFCMNILGCVSAMAVAREFSTPEIALADVALDHGASAVPSVAPNSFSEVADGDTEHTRFGWATYDESHLVARGQMTYIWTRKFAFDAPYTGPQSLLTTAESSYTLSFTGARGFQSTRDALR